MLLLNRGNVVNLLPGLFIKVNDRNVVATYSEVLFCFCFLCLLQCHCSHIHVFLNGVFYTLGMDNGSSVFHFSAHEYLSLDELSGWKLKIFI